MSKKSVFCITASRHEADQVIERLRSANFSSTDISVLLADGGKNPEFAQAKTATQTPEIVTGALVGGALGWIAGIGALAIPGVGLFLAAGQILTVFSGAALGAAAGGIAGGLIDLGIPEVEAKRYEGRVKTGKVLISVHTDDVGDIARARDIFKQTGAQDICTVGEAYWKGGPAAAETSGRAVAALSDSHR